MQAARGQTGKAIFVDEAHFIKPDVINNGVNSMLGENAYIVMASTPSTRRSGVQHILDAKLPNGEPICTVVDFEFNCPACKRRQVDNPSVMCVHRLHMRPHTQNMRSVMIARAAFGAASVAFRREMIGTTIVGANQFIAPDLIRELRDAPRHEAAVPPHYVYVSCDPNGSSRHYTSNNQSAYAIVTAYHDGGKTVVCILISQLFLRRSFVISNFFAFFANFF